MLTIYPNSELYQEIQKGNWAEEKVLSTLDKIIKSVDEDNLRNYRKNLRHL